MSEWINVTGVNSGRIYHIRKSNIFCVAGPMDKDELKI